MRMRCRCRRLFRRPCCGEARTGRTESVYRTRFRPRSANLELLEGKRDSRRLADELREAKIGIPKIRSMNCSWFLSVFICVHLWFQRFFGEVTHGQFTHEILR